MPTEDTTHFTILTFPFFGGREKILLALLLHWYGSLLKLADRSPNASLKVDRPLELVQKSDRERRPFLPPPPRTEASTTTYGGFEGSDTDGGRRSSSNSEPMHENWHIRPRPLPSPRLPGDALEEAMLHMTIQSDDHLEGIGTYSGPYPERPGKQDCAYYMRTGFCDYGMNCNFNHPPNIKQVAQYMSELPERVGQPECKHFIKTGTCKYGATCKYHHPRDRDGSRVQLNYLGLPMRQGEKECPYYMRTGSCKYGAICKFHHSEPTALLPDSGSPVYATAELSLSPASGSPYPAGLASWSLQRAPYVSGPHLQGPSTYMPVILSHQQSTPSVQPGWSTYHVRYGCQRSIP